LNKNDAKNFRLPQILSGSFVIELSVVPCTVSVLRTLAAIKKQRDRASFIVQYKILSCCSL